ncbi:hypothetical protein ITI46_25755 [Streptomyces oryzae]|uniref:Tetratricopeptide repeat protein n=1 Tax=Streptomyces oryzae TaxID=1434886 RepID=A0ABS3XHZ8_9ACTN|nr:hypothetical protein [Streptomyces oryzae]MBO8195032.1 hypothetical protein [Streptomyces oryzae]
MSTYQPSEVPAWPAYAFVVRDSGKVAVSGPLLPTSEHPTRTSAIDAVAAAAHGLGRPVRAEATEPDGTVWLLVISPDGAVGELAGGAQRGKPPKKRPSPAPAPVSGAPDVPADAMSQLEAHVAAGRMDEAVALAARLDENAADTLGLSHPDALRFREARARVTALTGDAVGAIRMYRDVAERWHYQGAAEEAEAVAAVADELWLQIPDPETAALAGVAILRMRNQIPGDGGHAFATVLAHQSHLEAALQ